MKIEEYIKHVISHGEENDNLLKLRKKIIPFEFSDPTLRKLISALGNEPIFFNNDEFYRLMSFDEVLNADVDLEIDMKHRGMIPFIDCGDNDFIVFNLGKGAWCKYNPVDDVSFSPKQNILDYFKNA